MLFLSSALNIALFTIICAGLHWNTRWARALFGPPSFARSTLFAGYLAALVFSLILLTGALPTFVLPLLLFQVSSIVAIPFTLEKVRHPVVACYIGISLVHCISIIQLVNAGPL